MADATSESFLHFILAALSELATRDGGSVLMTRLEYNLDLFDATLGDYICMISTFRQLMSRLHYYNLILFFRNRPFNLENVRTLLTQHCEKIKQSCGNVSIAILHAYSFMDILIIFWKYKGYIFGNKRDEFAEPDIKTCCEAVFRVVCKEDFEINEGRREFENFLRRPDMDTVFNFVKSCYVEEGFFTTQISSTGENKVYGKNFKEPSETLREKILIDYLHDEPDSLRNNLLSLAGALDSVTSSDSNEYLNVAERTDFTNLLNWHVRP